MAGSPTTPATATSRPAAPAVPTNAPTTPTPTTPTPTAGPADPLSPRPALESAPPPGLPTCRAADLSLSDADALTTATAAQEVFALRTSGPDCQLHGWPTVQLRDGGGRALSVEMRHGGFGISPGAPKVTTLSRGTSASFVVGTGRSGSCVAAATAVVGLPGVPVALHAATTMSVCAGQAGVSPIGRRGDGEAG